MAAAGCSRTDDGFFFCSFGYNSNSSLELIESTRPINELLDPMREKKRIDEKKRREDAGKACTAYDGSIRIHN